MAAFFPGKPLLLAPLRSAALLAAALAVAAPAPAQDDVLALIEQFLQDPDKDVRALAFEQIRTQVKGQAATRKFAALLAKLPPETQAGLVNALADRGDPAAAPEIRNVLSGNPPDAVKLSAIAALGALGDASDVGLLVKLLSSGAQAEQHAARGTLQRLAGEPVSVEIVSQLRQADAALAPALIEILTVRRAAVAVPQFIELAVHDDPNIRGAAMGALGEIAGPEHVEGMVRGVLRAEPGAERAAAERAVAAACQRGAPGPSAAAPLLAAMDKLNPHSRLALFSTLGRVGGADALRAVEAAIENSDSAVHAAGVAALCNWPDGSVAPRLLALARTEQHPQHRTMARRALIRIAPLADGRSDQRRLDLLRTVFAMCADDAERKLVLQRAKAVRTVETLRFVAPLMRQPPLAEEACLAVVELAHHSKLRETHRDEFHRNLDQVIRTSKDAAVIDRAQRYKKGQTWVRPKPAGG